MLSQIPRNSQLPQCARCLRDPNDPVHRSVDGHAFALTIGEAISGRLDEARARTGVFSVAGELAQSREQRSRDLAAEDERNALRALHARAPGLLLTGSGRLSAAQEAEILHQATSTDRQLAAEQLERGGHAPFPGKRLHEVLDEVLDEVACGCGDYPCCPCNTAETLGCLRLAIADALRARLGSSPALEDFVLAPEVR